MANSSCSNPFLKELHSPLPALEALDEENQTPVEELNSPATWKSSVPLDTLWKSPLKSSIFNRPKSSDDITSLCSIWSSGIRRFRVLILLVTVAVIWPCGFFSFQTFKSKTEATFSPIAGSPSEKAQNAFARTFNNEWRDPMDPTLYIVLEATNTSQSLANQSSPVYAEARNFTIGLNNFLLDHCWNRPGSNTKGGCHKDHFFKVTSYYSLVEKKTPRLSRDWMSPDGLSSLVEIKYLLPSHSMQHARDRILQVMDAIDEYGSSPELKISYAGDHWLESGLMKSAERDMYLTALLVLPLVLLLTGFVLPNARYSCVWFIPLFTTITTVCLWSILLYNVVATKMQVTQCTPSIMMSISLSFGVSYTLLLLARYLEDTVEPKRCVYYMLQKGGHVVLFSGLILICTFLCLCFLLLPMIVSVGVGGAIVVASSLLVNLITLPALLHTTVGAWIIKKQVDSSYTRHDSNDFSNDLNDQDKSYGFPKTSKQVYCPYKSGVTLVIAGAILFYVSSYSFQLPSSISFDLLPPVISPSLDSLRTFGSKVGLGSMYPYRILFDGHAAGKTIISPETFELMHLVVDEITAMENDGEMDGSTHVATDAEEVQAMINNVVKRALAKPKFRKNAELNNDTDVGPDYSCADRPTTYLGVAVLDNARIPHSLFQSMEYCAKVKPYCPVEVLRVLNAVDKDSTSADRFSTFITASPAMNPFSPEGIEWLRAARETIVRLENSGVLGGIQVYIEGAGATASDAVEAVYKALPSVISMTLLAVTLSLVLFYKSIIAAVRILLTSAITLAFSFGLEIIVCHHGMLEWTNLRFMSPRDHEVYWIVPVLAFSISLGLALSFDVFANCRTLEYRFNGFEHKESISEESLTFGRIIQATGVLNAIAFGSMSLSTNVVLNQLSFILTTAVLLETFVIQTIVSPFLMWVTGEYCWWPRRVFYSSDIYVKCPKTPRKFTFADVPPRTP